MEGENMFKNVKVDDGDMDVPEAPPGQININETVAFTCTRCGHEFFEESTLLRTVPAAKHPSGQDTTMPVKILRCERCKQAV